MKLFFSDFFEVSPEVLERYGAFNISLVNDLPLFIDPFLLFNSKKPRYRQLHEDILNYLRFLRDQSIERGEIKTGDLRALFTFPEIKQTWLGFSLHGNQGRGPGLVFAKALNQNMKGVFQNFDDTQIASSPHLEKLCLIKDNVGRDQISDFVTNLTLPFLLEYTQSFCQKNVNPKFLRTFYVQDVEFNYETGAWRGKNFVLPEFNQDYVILTPKDILTKDDTWINKQDLVEQYYDIARSIPNERLRAELNNYFRRCLPKKYTKKGLLRENSFAEKKMAIESLINKYPEVLDYYVKYKESKGNEAVSLAQEKVSGIENIFIKQVGALVKWLEAQTPFYARTTSSDQETYHRIQYLKDCVENKDGYKVFYYKHQPVAKESDVQLLFRFVWYGSHYDVNREVNNGRGPVDYKISHGASDQCLVEFKLASNPHLEQNLKHQLPVYQKANQSEGNFVPGYTVILYFSTKDKDRAMKILQKTELINNPRIILIDASLETKISASLVK